MNGQNIIGRPCHVILLCLPNGAQCSHFQSQGSALFRGEHKIRDEASVWIAADTKHLAHLIGRV